MSKRVRQYIGIAAALAVYYIVHEGAHLIAALIFGTFKELKFLGLGIQVDVNAADMTDTQLGIFCLVGALATLIAAYALTLSRERICRAKSRVFRASAYYVTIALLMLDPLYLSLLCGLFGGGDMNGIKLLIPEPAARITAGLIFILNLAVFIIFVLPSYKRSFQSSESPS